MFFRKPPSKPELGLPPSSNNEVSNVKWTDLPLSCPMPGTSLWDGHPRVYLPIHRNGREMCPYCSTVYVLEDPRLNEPDPVFANIEIEHEYHKAKDKIIAGLGKE